MLLALCVSCKDKKSAQTIEEDRVAKKTLQGVWIDEDEEDVVFRIKGDTVFFPDSTIMPVAFKVCRDTFYMEGTNRVAYPIVKHTPHLFVFVNQNGEQVRLVKSNDKMYLSMFDSKSTPISINQNKLLKRDTVLVHNNERYHSYVQVNPTTYKVMKATCNDDGVQVDNVYYDNIIHLSVFKGNTKVFSSNLLRTDFKSVLSEKILDQLVFSDLTLTGIDDKGIHYNAILAIPDSMTSYIVEVTVGFDGTITRHINNK